MPTNVEMIMNFESILTYVTLTAGVIVLLDVLFLARRRAAKMPQASMPMWIEYARSFFPILLIVLLLRSFLAEPFRIPSGSLKPTLQIGDFILVNKYTYGIRLPVLHTKIVPLNEPKTGDIVVFRWPVDPSMHLIKRVVGMPGDRISYIDKVLYINGKPSTQTLEGQSFDDNEGATRWPVVVKSENLQGVKHRIYQRPNAVAQDFEDLVVPEGEYFVVGDNRDDSNDSRSWGFVPESNIIGKAMWVLLSWDATSYRIRWQRTGMAIH